MAARDSNSWSDVTTSGIPKRAHITDIAEVFANKVWAVGWTPTGHHHRIAGSWRWGAGRWHPTDVPAGVSRSRLFAVSMDSDGPAYAAGTDAAKSPSKRALIIRAK